MAERWVVNASPLILLGNAEVISFLPSLCDELVVPAGVVAEVQRGRIADAGRRWLDGDGRKFVRPAVPIPAALANWSGGAGEAEVVAWAIANAEFTAVLDDRAARQMAARQGVKVLRFAPHHRSRQRAWPNPIRAAGARKTARQWCVRER